MDYKFRELNSTDMFPIFKLINKIGLYEFKDCFQSDEIKKAISEIGENKDNAALSSVGISVMFEIANVLIKNIPSCQDDIYSILASVSDLTKKDLEKMSMSDFMQMIVDFIKKEDFKDFFTVVLKLFK